MDDDIFPGDLTGGFTTPDPGTPSPPRSPQGPVVDWTQDEPRRPRRLALLFVAAVPWLVLLLFLLRPTADGAGAQEATTPADPDPTWQEASPTAGPTATATATPTPTTAAPTEYARVFGQTRSPAQVAGAIAVIVTRAHLGTAGPAPRVAGVEPGPPGRYVEHVVVEAVDMPAPGAAVVTVVAVVLTASEDQYDGVELVRLAVPVVFDGSRAAPAGQPWRLPGPDLSAGALAPAPDDDPAVPAAATDALTTAGYLDITDLQVASGDGWPVVVQFRGVAPDQTEPRTHVLWLRRHLDRLIVAGTPQETTR